MFTKHRALVTAALLFTVFCVLPLSAQMNSFTSNTSNATNGLFTTETDNFLDVNKWQEVEFNKFFTAMQADFNNGIGAGVAAKAGSAYLGFGYFGNLWSGSLNSTTTKYGDNYAAAAWKGKDTVVNSANLAWTNQVSFLLGTQLLGGILLDCNLAGLGNNNNDTDSLDAGGNKTTYKNSAGVGSIEGGLSWGKNFDLGSGLVLMPKLGFRYNASVQKSVTNPGTPGSVKTTALNGIDPYFSQASGYTAIQNGQVGLTGIIGAHAGLEVDRSAGAWDGSLWAGYDFETHTYDNQISDSSGYWEGYNPSYTGHLINLGVSFCYTLDRKLSFGWSVEGDFGIVNAKVTSVQTQNDAMPDHNFTDAVYGIAPKLSAGVVYKALPDKFNFNASLALYPLEYSYRKFTHSDISGVMTTTTDTSSIINAAYATTSLGFTWFITDGFSLDAATGVNAASTTVDITNFSVLLSYRR